MNKNLITNIKSLFKCCISNKELFERRKNSIFFPLLILVFILCIMTIPPYLKAKSTTGEEIMEKFPKVSVPMEELFSISLDCKIENSKLVCNENAQQINKLMGDEIKYTVIVNTGTNTTPIEVKYEEPKDTDNLILLLSNNVKIRYCQRDYVNKKIITYEIIGGYSQLNGFDFTEVSENIKQNPDIAKQEIESFFKNIYLSTLINDGFTSALANSIASFSIFLLTTALIIKLPTLFKKSKGFRFGECIKISLTSSLPALLIATVFSLITPFDFSSTFSMIYIIRILYIYFRYMSSKSNNIFKTLYLETKEERFNF